MQASIKKAIVIILSVFIVTMFIIPIYAASQYTPISGGNTYMDKYLIMKEDANVPVATFSYTITGTGNAKQYDVAGTNKKIQVLDGVGTPTITWDSYQDGSPNTVKFQPSDTTTTKAQHDANAQTLTSDLVKNLVAGEKYAKHTATINFSNCSYTEPGIYRYKIEETAISQTAITNDGNLVRYLDVYVVDNNGSLEVSGYILHSSDADVPMATTNGSDSNANYPQNKTQGYSNRYTTFNLTFSKTVTGNQASRDKYFEFTFQASRLNPGTLLTVSIENDNNQYTADGNADANPTETDATVYTNMINPTTLTATNSGTITQKFYLQHGQSIVIRGIPETIPYSITEREEDYKPDVTKGEGQIATAKNAVTVDSTSMDNTTAFTNQKAGTVPTGIIITFLPFFMLMIAGAVGILIILVKKNHGEKA